MSNLIHPEMVIFSAELSTHTPDINRKRTQELEDYFKRYGIHYIRCKGIYKNTREESFLCHLTEKFTYDHAVRIALEHLSQESILFRDKDKNGFLIYKKGIEELGTIDRVTIQEAKKQENYTYFPHASICWGVTSKPTDMPG